MPELEAHTKGRDVLLMFEKDIGPDTAFACNYNDTMHMAKTVEMIRFQLATTKTTFSGSLVFEDIDDSIPPPLFQTTTFDINKSRLELFTRKQRQYDTISPARAALLEHTKRATYQGGHVWGQAVIHDQRLPSPGDCGWVKENADGMWIPHWTQVAAIAASCQELHKCGCKKTCSGRCKCYKAGLTRTALCSCSC
ncbi:Hypothetical predicted protein [Mytilus galloprovincialis]|uniref:Tesmin/TSO1-like CXC domain-containing protein n=1 Tax=Mytilus galloprovincialis TaxID=29158 RepID=A0A8B6GHC7_MYTGA|nr:Hypothetical predicted protein [Mytilus galloprovincialis]